MTYTETVETRGNYRAVIAIDEAPPRPDGDFFGTIIWLDDRGRHTEVFAHAYQQERAAQDFAGQVNYLWEHYRDMKLVERYLRICEGIVGFDYFEGTDSKFVNIVTRKDLDIWGWSTDPAEWPKHDDGTTYKPHEGNLDEAKAWAEGDVWYRYVEKRVTWHTDDEDFEDRDEWEEEPDSALYGLYGQKYAEESAREALDEYADTTEEV